MEANLFIVPRPVSGMLWRWDAWRGDVGLPSEVAVSRGPPIAGATRLLLESLGLSMTQIRSHCSARHPTLHLRRPA